MAHINRLSRVRLVPILIAIAIIAAHGWVTTALAAVGTWSNYNGPTTEYTLRSISMVSENDGWAVGMKTAPNGTPNGGVLLRWNGASWQIFSSGTSALFGIDMVSASDGWAVGQNSSGSPLILRWNGSAWTSISLPNCTKRLNSVAMASANRGWAVGLDCIATWNGSAWSGSTLTTTNALDTVTAVSETEAWAVGNDALAHLTGGVWSFTYPILYDRYYSLSAVSASDIWGAGYFNGRLLHYDGANWTVHTTLTGHSFFGVTMLNASDGWAVGDIIAHWDGTSWSQVAGPYSSSLWSADFKGFSGWAVGYDGKMLRYKADPPFKIYLPMIKK